MGYEFKCDCGNFGFIWGDDRSYAAHVVPDQRYDEFSGLVDDAIEKSGPSPRDKDAACMAWRQFPMSMVWQCPNCGSVHVDGPDGQHHRFTPASGDAPKRLFAPQQRNG